MYLLISIQRNIIILCKNWLWKGYKKDGLINLECYMHVEQYSAVEF